MMLGQTPIKAHSPADARRLVRAALVGASATVAETVELLVSELVTNALLHGSGDRFLMIDLQSDCVHVEVHDGDRTPDLAPLKVDALSEHGRGLAIVDALVSSWGVVLRDDGKTVWFDLHL
jgi:anti-sigma regulatory factor (Ser/Thr protein kinase)